MRRSQVDFWESGTRPGKPLSSRARETIAELLFLLELVIASIIKDSGASSPRSRLKVPVISNRSKTSLSDRDRFKIVTSSRNLTLPMTSDLLLVTYYGITRLSVVSILFIFFIS